MAFYIHIQQTPNPDALKFISQYTVKNEGKSNYRSAEEGVKWPLGDPIARLKKHVIGLGIWDEERHAAMDKELAEMVRAAQKEAEKNGILADGLKQSFDSMFEDVFEEMPWHLKEQQQQMLDERKAAGI